MTAQPIGAFWLRVPEGEFYNIERGYALAKGGGGATYFEIPQGIVPAFFDFMGLEGADRSVSRSYHLQVAAAADPSVVAPLEIGPKSGQRLRIMRQNRHFSGQERHPAWTHTRGFPEAPGDVPNRDAAAAFLQPGGLRIWMIKFDDDAIHAGFNQGYMPAGLDANNQKFWQPGRGGYFTLEP